MINGRSSAVLRALGICLLLLGSTVLATTMQSVQPAAATVAFPGQQLLQVPFRWCAVRGSDAQTNPMSVGEPTTNDYLWRRHERASDRVLIPGAMITGRSAFAAAHLGRSFPIIDDPIPPSSGGPGALGDMVAPAIDTAEVKLAWAACDAAWDALTGPGVLVGFPAVNLHRFVNQDGSAANQTGYAEYNASFGDPGTFDRCTIPPTITSATFVWSGRLAVADYSLTRGFDPDDLVVAHEFGHAAGLDHGNGLNEGGGGFDLSCDPSENVNATPHSFMTPGGSLTRAVTSLQRNHMRTILLRYSGTQIDPPAALVNADTISDQRTDAVLDVLDVGVDLASVAVAEIPTADTTVISHLLFGLIPAEDVENQYVLFADLDNDVNTGGAPADLGFTTGFQGAELVTRVVVGPGYQTTPTVWIYRNGSLEEENRDFISEVSSQIGSETGEEVAHVVSLALPTSVRGPANVPFRLQAIAEQLQGELEFDILPNGSLDGSRPISLVPPVYPVCAVEPPQPAPGDTVVIEVSGLTPGQGAHVVLGDVLVSTGQIDGDGNASIEFQLPGDTRSGPRLVTVGVDGTALTADCVINVLGGEQDGTERQSFVGSWRLQGGDQDGLDAAIFTLHEDGTALGVLPDLGIGLGFWETSEPSMGAFTLVFPMAASEERGPRGTLTVRGNLALDENGAATISPLIFESRAPDGAVTQRELEASAVRVDTPADDATQTP
ncbi:MAG: hypothetical protein M3Q50_07170 [Chloroflexota bacterium]|nr:hypothetical protein [Chloroflexota bacterium]